MPHEEPRRTRCWIGRALGHELWMHDALSKLTSADVAVRSMLARETSRARQNSGGDIPASHGVATSSQIAFGVREVVVDARCRIQTVPWDNNVHHAVVVIQRSLRTFKLFIRSSAFKLGFSSSELSEELPAILKPRVIKGTSKRRCCWVMLMRLLST